MPRKKAEAKTDDTVAEPRDAGTGRPRGGNEQEIAVDEGDGPEPGDINSSLDSDRMKALLEDHRKMGSRP